MSQKKKRIPIRPPLELLIRCIIIFTLVFSVGCSPKNKANSQNPTWDKAGGAITSGQYRTIAVADLDNDGNLDMIGGSTIPGTVAVWYGDGTGNFTEFQFLPVKADVRSISAADIDNDGLLDLIFSVQREALGIKVWKNNYGRKWVEATSPDEVRKYEGIRTTDINRDGHEDIIAANSTELRDGGIQVWLGDGKGGWPIETGPTSEGIYMDVAVADFNKDGELDIAGAGWGTDGALRVWYGDGIGGWASIAPLKLGNFYALSVGDLNEDGNLDILAGSYRKGVHIFYGDGKGGFQIAPSPMEAGSYWKVLPADLDDAGKLDLIASSADDQGIAVWRNIGSDKWQPIEGRFPSKGVYYNLLVGDLNKDDRNDLLAASFGEGIKIWMGKGGVPAVKTAQAVRQIPPTEKQESPDEVLENDVFVTVDGIVQYKIGPGDTLEITFWKGTKGTKEDVLVRPDGNISFGFVEDLNVNGLTAKKLDALLTSAMKEFIRDPRLDVVVKKPESKYVTMMGAIEIAGTAQGPGRYVLKGKISLLEMLNIAGGPTNDANLNSIRIRRKDNRSFNVDLFKAIIQGDKTQDVILNEGDLVIVPSLSKTENRVYLYGEVGKPGVYNFTGSEFRIFDAISQAGGVTLFAKESSTKIVRGDISRPEVISADLKKLIETGDHSQNIALKNGDLVYVPRSFIGDINRFVRQISPLVQLIVTPAVIRDQYGSGSALRFSLP